jgi:hypothetical protein
MVPVRAVPALASTEYATAPDAVPLPDVTWTQFAVVEAVQVQPAVVITAKLPVAPAAAIVPLLVGLSV